MSRRAPTYEEMRAQRAKDWAKSSAAFSRNLSASAAAIMAAPDVAHAPVKGQPYAHEDLACPKCAFRSFVMDTWVTVNGVRYRTWLLCEGCHEEVVYDWTVRRWISDDPNLTERL